MKLEKSIEILTQLNTFGSHRLLGREPVALLLGIEAMKRIQSQYDPDHQMMRIPLPGETKED